MPNIISLLSSEAFRRRPGMYLAKFSILHLRSFIDGYYLALQLHNVEDSNDFDFFEFNEFVAKKYKKPAQVGWMNIIYADNFCDEAQSFSSFFKDFDQFLDQTKVNSAYYTDLINLYRGHINQEEFTKKYGKITI